MTCRSNHLSVHEQSDRRLVVHTFRTPAAFTPTFFWVTAVALATSVTCWIVFGLTPAALPCAVSAFLITGGGIVQFRHLEGYTAIEIESGEWVKVYTVRPSDSRLVAELDWDSITEVSVRAVEVASDETCHQLGAYVVVRTGCTCVRVGELYLDREPNTIAESVAVLRRYFGDLLVPVSLDLSDGRGEGRSGLAT